MSDLVDDDMVARLRNMLIGYNEAHAGVSDYRRLSILVVDDQKSLVGGLVGYTARGWLFTELLYLPESLRKQGLGRELMERAENEAVARGCHSAWLDTYEFQARGFYERFGYECFGEQEDHPVGFSRYFMKKNLAQ